MIHASRRAAALLVVFVAVAAGCSRGSSGNPTTKGMLARANNWGHYGVVHTASTGVTKIVKGSWKCHVSFDKSAKTVSTACTGTSTDGKPIAFTSLSTYDQLKKLKTRALPGKITIKVDGVVKATPTCVGPNCPGAVAATPTTKAK